MYSPGNTRYTNRSPSWALLGFLCLFVLSYSGLLLAQDARVDTVLSSPSVNIDESVLLNVRAIAIDEELDTSALNENFDVITRSSSRQVSIINGKRTSMVEWVLELLPKREGQLDIPPVQVGSLFSQPHILIVEPAAQGAQRALFLDAFVDQKEPYVQSQVIYTLRVYQDITVLDGSLSVPEAASISVTQLGGDNRFEETVDGRRYTVLERRFAMFAQESGEIEIPPVVLQASVAQDANRVPNSRTRTRRLTRRSPAITLSAKSRPDDYTGAWWLPSQQVIIEEQWSQPPDSIEVDQPVTRSISLRALGVGEAQLPEITVPEVDGLSIYADAPVSASNATAEGVVSEQKSSWAVIAQRAGVIQLPEVKVDWFNLRTGKAEVATLPARSLTISPAPIADGQNTDAAQQASQANGAVNADGSSQNVPLESNTVSPTATANAAEPATQTSDATPKDASNNVGLHESTAASANDTQASVNWWRNMAVLLLLLWPLSLVCVWLWHRRTLKRQFDRVKSAQSQVSAHQLWQRRAGSPAALAAVKAACETGTVSKIARAVVYWGAMVWPDDPPSQLLGVADKLNNSEVHEKLSALDAVLYRDKTLDNAETEMFSDLPQLLGLAVKQASATPASDDLGTQLPSL